MSIRNDDAFNASEAQRMVEERNVRAEEFYAVTAAELDIHDADRIRCGRYQEGDIVKLRSHVEWLRRQNEDLGRIRTEQAESLRQHARSAQEAIADRNAARRERDQLRVENAELKGQLAAVREEVRLYDDTNKSAFEVFSMIRRVIQPAIADTKPVAGVESKRCKPGCACWRHEVCVRKGDDNRETGSQRSTSPGTSDASLHRGVATHSQGASPGAANVTTPPSGPLLQQGEDTRLSSRTFALSEDARNRFTAEFEAVVEQLAWFVAGAVTDVYLRGRVEERRDVLSMVRHPDLSEGMAPGGIRGIIDECIGIVADRIEEGGHVAKADGAT